MAGAPQHLARMGNAPIVNAGDGSHEHPTQALLDALTIREHKARIEGLEGRDHWRHAALASGAFEYSSAYKTRRDRQCRRAWNAGASRIRRTGRPRLAS